MGDCFAGGEEILESKLMLDALEESICILKEKGLDEKPLVEERMQLYEDFTRKTKELLQTLSDKDNTIRLEGLWYAVRYNSTKGEPLLGIFAIDEEDLPLFQVASGRSSGLKKTEIDTLVPAMEDEATKAMYLNKVEKKITSILLEAGLMEGEEVSPIGTMSVSGHACKRWVQRKLQIFNESKVNKYLRENGEKVQKAVLESYKASECIWVDQEDIEYWFNEENIVFVVGNSTVITLYEKDFGFSPQINRDIVMSQLDLIKKDWKLLQQAEKDYLGSIDKLNLECSQYDSEIEVLEEKIKFLRAEQEIVRLRIDALAKDWRCKKQDFNQEFSKLFSRHKPK